MGQGIWGEKRGKSMIIKNPRFEISAVKPSQYPNNDLPQIVLVGKSNVGKSSLINAITNSKIAVVSKTPGRTKQINFFQVGDSLTIVDMPGYGYAKAGKQEVQNWNALIFKYLLNRINLKRVFLLIDSRHLIKSNDEEMMDILDKSGILYQIILTKVDEVNPKELELKLKSLTEVFKKHPALFDEVLYASSQNNIGIEELRNLIYDLK